MRVRCRGRRDCRKRKVEMMKHFVIFAMRKKGSLRGRGEVGMRNEWKIFWVGGSWKNKYFILLSFHSFALLGWRPKAALSSPSRDDYSFCFKL